MHQDLLKTKVFGLGGKGEGAVEIGPGKVLSNYLGFLIQKKNNMF
jgi:hypothetical protein